MKIEADPKRIEEELKEYAGRRNFRVRAKKLNGLRLSVRETDKLIDIKIDPRNIRTQGQLDLVMERCLESFIYGG